MCVMCQTKATENDWHGERETSALIITLQKLACASNTFCARINIIQYSCEKKNIYSR